jgi:Zn finger protein HypA/HybF involved in hydrogenase expression
MTTIAYLLSAVLGLFGLIMLIGSAQGNTVTRIITGVVLLGAAAALVFLGRMKAPERTIVQKIDLTGDVAAQDLKCKSCGGKLDSNSVTVEAGAVFIKCPYCGAQYQLEEAPKW